MLIMQGWQNFYMLTGAAAATLIGLLFVAITTGGYVPAQKAIVYLQTFVTPTLLYYFQVLLVACLAVIPLQSTFVFSGALLILGATNCYLALKVLLRTRMLSRTEEQIDNEHWLWHITLPCTVGVLLITSAIGYFFSEPLALAGFAIVQLLNLAIGVRNTWTLTIWLTLRRGAHSSKESNSSSEKSVEEAERIDV